MNGLDAETEVRLAREHYEKYEALSKRIGIDALCALVPATKEEIEAALILGDAPLNTIVLRKWDVAAGCVQTAVQRRTQRFPLSFESPWHRAHGLSLAERVCALKHVARYHIANAEVPGGAR